MISSIELRILPSLFVQFLTNIFTNKKVCESDTSSDNSDDAVRKFFYRCHSWRRLFSRFLHECMFPSFTHVNTYSNTNTHTRYHLFMFFHTTFKVYKKKICHFFVLFDCKDHKFDNKMNDSILLMI